MAAIDIDRIRSAASRESLAIRTIAKTGSTNRVLMDAPFGPAPGRPFLLATAEQSAGRGRRGRQWVMEPGRSVAFSIAIERFAHGACPAPGLPIAVGVATARALAALVPDVRLKWPNDLQRERRKFGGILVESRRGPAGPSGASGSSGSSGSSNALVSSARLPLERFVIGIGLNLLAPRDAGARIGQPAGGLFADEVLPLPAEAVIGRVAAAVVDAVGCLLEEGLARFRRDWDRFDVLRDEEVAVLDDGHVAVVGIARGIDDSGALILETASGLRAITWGEVSVRALAAAPPEK